VFGVYIEVEDDGSAACQYRYVSQRDMQADSASYPIQDGNIATSISLTSSDLESVELHDNCARSLFSSSLSTARAVWAMDLQTWHAVGLFLSWGLDLGLEALRDHFWAVWPWSCSRS